MTPQPIVIAPLPPAEYPAHVKPHQLRVLLFDPAPIYARCKVDHYKRHQSVSITAMFPKTPDKKCGCGCGADLTERRTRWATDDCMKFAQAVFAIINGWAEPITNYLRLVFPNWACCGCGVMDQYREYSNGIAANAIQKDHIIGVKHGGGGCWLANYQLLCHDCHHPKTKNDFKPKPIAEQIELPLISLADLQSVF